MSLRDRVKVIWRWRCKKEVPLLDEVEYSEIAALYRQGTIAIKEFRRRTNSSLKSPSISELWEPVRMAHERFTGTVHDGVRVRFPSNIPVWSTLREMP